QSTTLTSAMPASCPRSLATRNLHSFPTRRSSDLIGRAWPAPLHRQRHPRSTDGQFAFAPSLTRAHAGIPGPDSAEPAPASAGSVDRKSTRLNSSHQIISYAVFCLKKKNINTIILL